MRRGAFHFIAGMIAGSFLARCFKRPEQHHGHKCPDWARRIEDDEAVALAEYTAFDPNLITINHERN